MRKPKRKKQVKPNKQTAAALPAYPSTPVHHANPITNKTVTLPLSMTFYGPKSVSGASRLGREGARRRTNNP